MQRKGTRAFQWFSGACLSPVSSRSLQEVSFSFKASKGSIRACKASGLTQNIIKGVVNSGNTVSAHPVAVPKNLGQTTVVGEWRTQGKSSHSSRAQSTAVPQNSVPSGVHSSAMVAAAAVQPMVELGRIVWLPGFEHQNREVSVFPEFTF